MSDCYVVQKSSIDVGGHSGSPKTYRNPDLIQYLKTFEALFREGNDKQTSGFSG